jgi:hypothetical protein
MDDATQKLVDDARRRADELTELAIDHAYGHEHDTEWWGDAHLLERLANALEAAQRPPVSPEVREALVDTLTSPVRAPGSVAASRVFRAETPEDLEDATALADAILARFSLPVLDVEKVARWLSAEFDDTNGQDHTAEESWDFWGEDATRVAAALVASLHTLTADSTPADTERNES